MTLKLGVVGLSPGNGHPYSWSAIFNGYDLDEMATCGFPAIPEYLAKQVFPRDLISAAQVTHVWTQDKMISKKIAKAAKISCVVDHYSEMVGEVDGILLARDDAENHVKYAAPFLLAGIPIYIDKPLALNTADARGLFERQLYPGQIFSCSALRYAKEFQLSQSVLESIGEITHVHACVPNGWDKYAIHVIEPLLLLIPNRGKLKFSQAFPSGDATTLVAEYAAGVQVLISAVGTSKCPISIKIYGKKGWKEMVFKDTYFAFKSALSEFISGVRKHREPIDLNFTLEVVSLIEAGRAL
jgi:predicted dehydrogenase